MGVGLCFGKRNMVGWMDWEEVGGWGVIRGYCVGLDEALIRVVSLVVVVEVEERIVEGEVLRFW